MEERRACFVHSRSTGHETERNASEVSPPPPAPARRTDVQANQTTQDPTRISTIANLTPQALENNRLPPDQPANIEETIQNVCITVRDRCITYWNAQQDEQLVSLVEHFMGWRTLSGGRLEENVPNLCLLLPERRDAAEPLVSTERWRKKTLPLLWTIGFYHAMALARQMSVPATEQTNLDPNQSTTSVVSEPHDSPKLNGLRLDPSRRTIMVLGLFLELLQEAERQMVQDYDERITFKNDGIALTRARSLSTIKDDPMTCVRQWKTRFLTVLSNLVPFSIRHGHTIEVHHYLVRFMARAGFFTPGIDLSIAPLWQPHEDDLTDPFSTSFSDCLALLFATTRAFLVCFDIERAEKTLMVVEKVLRRLENILSDASFEQELHASAETLIQNARTMMIHHRGLVMASRDDLGEAIDAFDAAAMLFESMVPLNASASSPSDLAQAHSITSIEQYYPYYWVLCARNNSAVCLTKTGDTTGALERWSTMDPLMQNAQAIAAILDDKKDRQPLQARFNRVISIIQQHVRTLQRLRQEGLPAPGLEPEERQTT